MRILKIPTLPSSKEQGWIDRDRILIHAMFTVLVDFIEKEKPHEHFACASPEFDPDDWDFTYRNRVLVSGDELTSEEREAALAKGRAEYDERHGTVWGKLFDLYHWWKAVRPNREAILAELWLKNSKAAFALEQDFEREDIENMKCLAELNGHLWT